tara:strand:+ start:547 stop:837 length:291 start_codon:yes stop_codon:yes gene_type:complete
MTKEIGDIVSEENYGNTSWNENGRNQGFLGLPNPSQYQNQEKFKTDLQFRINNFLEEIGYDDEITDDIQFYSRPDRSTNSDMDNGGIYINKTPYLK